MNINILQTGDLLYCKVKGSELKNQQGRKCLKLQKKKVKKC